MDELTQTRIFEPFFTTKPIGKGTGMGLSTVFEIVNRRGGSIRVDSRTGEGTTFTVLFPRTTEVLTPMAVHGAMEPLPRGSETILVVENDSAVRDLLTRLLKARGYRVLAAATGAEALRIFAARSAHIALVLTDVVLSDGTGPDVARRILRIRSDVKVLFTSGHCESAVLDREVRAPGLPLLEKPFTTAMLATKIRELLASSARGRSK